MNEKFQALVSHALHPVLNNLNVVYLRIALSVICTVFFVILFTTGIISHVYYHGELFLSITLCILNAFFNLFNFRQKSEEMVSE